MDERLSTLSTLFTLRLFTQLFNPVGSLSLSAAEKGSLEEIRRPPFSHKQVLWRLSALARAMNFFGPLEIAPLGAGGPGAPADQPASDA